jgi:phosphoribosyl 1,2-cyclic phosphodiesterase
MFHFAVLGSGSSGNSYYFEYKGAAFLLDAGYSCREILRRMETCRLDQQKLKGLVITHLHQDHFRGAEVLARQLDIPVFLHKQHTYNTSVLFKKSPGNIMAIEENRPFDLAGFSIHPFTTNHDSPHSLSFSRKTNQTEIAVITDTGKTNSAMLEAAGNADILFLESNYDLTMLMEGPYHYALKKRIISDKGHLSNEDAVRFLNEIHISGNTKLKKVFFCHLSGTNNHPDLLERYLEQHLNWQGEWQICPKGSVLDPLNRDK